MAGDTERQYFSTSCVLHVAPRPVRRTICGVAVVKWQKLLGDTPAANGRQRRCYWHSSSTCGATVQYLLWAIFASSALGNSASAAPNPMLDAQSGNKSSNSSYASIVTNPGQSVSPFASATTLTSLSHTFPAGSSQGQSDTHSQTAGPELLAPGPPVPTTLQESTVGDDHLLEAEHTLPTVQHKRRSRHPAGRSLDWDTFSSLVGGRKEQSSPMKGSTATSETEEQVPQVSVRDYTTSTVGLLPGSVTDVAFTAQGAAGGPEVEGGSLSNKGPRRQSGSPKDKLLGSKTSAKVTSEGSGKARARLAPDDQLRGRDRDTLESKQGHEEDRATQTLLDEPVRQTTPVRQESKTLPSRADLRATSRTAAEMPMGRNFGWESHVKHQRDADLVNVTEEKGRTKSAESGALENILMKILEQTTVPKESAVEGGGDNKHALVLRLFDSEALAPGGLVREHSGSTQSRVEDAALTRTGTSVAEDACGLRDDGNSLSSRGPSSKEDLLSTQTLAHNGLRGALAIHHASEKSGRKTIAPQQTTEQSNTKALRPDAHLLLSHRRIREQATRDTHGVEADTEVETSPDMLPLSQVAASALRYDPQEDETESLARGEEVVLNSLSEEMDAGGVPHVGSDPLDEEQEFLQLLLNAVRSKDNTSGMQPTADNTGPLTEAPTLPTSAGDRRTIRPKTEGIITPTRTHIAEDATLSSPTPHPDRRATSTTATHKSGLQGLQPVREEALKKRVHWNLQEIHKQSAMSSEVEDQSGDEPSLQLTADDSPSEAARERPRTRDAMKGRASSGTMDDWNISRESAVSGEDATLVGNKSKDPPAEDGSTKDAATLPLKSGAEGAYRAHAPVGGTLTEAHSSLQVDSAPSLTLEPSHRYRKGFVGEHPVKPRPLASKPGSRGGVDLEVVPNGDTSAVHPRTAPLPVAAHKQQKRRLSFQLRKAHADSPAEREGNNLGKSDPARVGKQQLTRRHTRGIAAVKHNQDGAAIVSSHESPGQAHPRQSLEGIHSIGKIVDVLLKGTTKLGDSPKTPQETVTQLLLQKQRLLSTVTELIRGVGSGIRPYAAFLDKEDPLDQSAFQKVAKTYPEVLRALLFFRHPSRLPAASISRFNNEVRSCEAMVKNLRHAVDQLRSIATGDTAKESLCPHLLKQKVNVADQAVSTAQLFARVVFNSYQLACHYVQERQFTHAVDTATTMSRVIPEMYNIFVYSILPTVPASGRVPHDPVEDACPFQQHQNDTLVKEEISLQRRLIAHLSDLAECLDVGSRFEAALDKLTAVLNRRPRMHKSTPPDLLRSKSRAKSRKRTAELFSG